MTAIKVCGITDVPSGLAAIDAGADYLGFVFYPPSPRAVDVPSAVRLVAALRERRPESWLAVGVFVNEPLGVVERTRETCGLDVVQLNGDEGPEYVRSIAAPVFKAVRVRNGTDLGGERLPMAQFFGAQRILVDANVPGRYGGTGVAYDWVAVRTAVTDGFLAGGLTPENVGRALESARPWGVDVSSGVEHYGAKSPELISRFIEAVREHGP